MDGTRFSSPPIVRSEYSRRITKGMTREYKAALDKGGPEELAAYCFSLEALSAFEDCNEEIDNPDYTLGALLAKDLKDLMLLHTTSHEVTYGNCE